jgi:glycosyltransferase involved in cell wall biosynthesis
MNQRLKILAICSWYPSKKNTTLGNFVQKHIEAISLLNNVTVLTIISIENIKSITIEDSYSENLSEIIVYYPKTKKYFEFLNIIMNFINHIRAFKKGYQLLVNKKGKPDLTHLHVTYPLGIWAIYLKIRYKIRYIITEHSSGFHSNTEHTYTKFKLFLSKLVFSKATFILPISENLKENIEKISPKSNFKIISNVVNEHVFNTSSINNNKNQLLHISTGDDSIKNLTGMITVISEIYRERNDFHFNIVSDGNIEYAKKLVNELKCNEIITFHSTKTTIEIAHFFNISNALLMFSNYENFPCVIAESLMSGIPVITSNVNGIPEHINSINGILVHPKDNNELKKAILDFFNHDIEFNSELIRNYALIHFSYSSISKSFDEIYKKVLAKNNTQL